jgi:hypothetical protein
MNNAKQRKKEPKTIPPTPIYFFFKVMFNLKYGQFFLKLL